LFDNAEDASKKCLLEDGGYLFVVNPPATLCPVDEKPRFSVNFQDKTYAVAEPSPCDHTLSVLAVVSLAINLNKSATDIRITPVLQVVP
jgi:hypothetical protein